MLYLKWITNKDSTGNSVTVTYGLLGAGFEGEWIQVYA